ncbi:class I SAM-dependent methyltransferase [Sorangium atrum]|uniref:Methyltransferase domain-containing protein n=1 Tax=Sorangium atrum TaxID=2995308 RepID=A0ABT5C1Z4_9BACT|nr:class I SAM-dependent methyltransferase [Sorangium aterium]MDC0679784.1 methyltransferase domain-containing protein [Sorangium aterium]
MTTRAPAGYEADQRRDDLSAYARYLSAMDASMRQKVALTAAHLLCEGRVADMGMGSGQGSAALAQLYPRLEVIGVDIDPTVVELARRAHQQPNLGFQLGDIARTVFPPESLDGIFDSSVLHHVTSYGGYRHANAADALAAQVEQLAPGGVLVVRDFVDPGPGTVFLDVPAEDGDDGRDPRSASTAALLERFAGEFRSLSPEPGFPLARVAPEPSGELPAPRMGWRRYRLAHKHAVEFVLRKDYRADWEAEVKEEYTYFSQAQFEALFARLGLRVLSSTPLRNPWIVRNRFVGRFELRDATGARLPYPPTNYLIVGEKVKAGQGVAFRLAPAESSQQFLRIEHHQDRATGQVFDLAARPHPTLDIVPFFFAGETAYVLARTSYPRPIARACREETPPLDGSGPADYLAEPIAVVQTEFPVGHTVEHALERAAGVRAAAIQRMIPGTTYYPSPGGILEEVRSMLVEVEPTFVNAPSENVSGFGTSGRIRAVEARQLLRAAQVGGLPDARLELNVYDLLARFGLPFGPWIGDEIPLPAAGAGRRGAGDAGGAGAGDDGGVAAVQPTSLAALLGRPSRRRFSRVDAGASAGFLEVRRARFEELTADGGVVAARELEYVVPRPLGVLTVSTALLARAPSGEVVLGVDDHDLPAAQSFSGNSGILVAPAWRLPRSVSALAAAEAFVRERLQVEYGVRVEAAVELGGAYRPSAGLTPELVQPLAFVVTAAPASAGTPASAAAPDLAPGSGAARRLSWVPLIELVAGRERLPDGHLRVAALRAAHALGLAISPPHPR